MPKKFGGGVGEQIDFAVAAVHQVGKDFVGNMLDGIFGGVEAFDVGESGVLDQRGILEADFSRRGDDATADVVEGVAVGFDVDRGIDLKDVGFEKVFLALGTDVEESDNGDFGGRVEEHVVAKANQHVFSAGSVGPDVITVL